MQFKVVGTSGLSNRMRTRRVRLGRRRTVNKKAVIIIDRWIQKNFQAEGGLLDNKWKPLAPSTEEARRKGRKTAKGNKILQDTGDMRMKWKHHYDNTKAFVRSGVPYAIYHDSEKPRKGKLPRRQILPDKKHVMDKLLKIYGEHVRTNLR